MIPSTKTVLNLKLVHYPIPARPLLSCKALNYDVFYLYRDIWSIQMSYSDKKSRSLRLNNDVNERLEEVCKAFGVNANSYILNAVGKAVMADYLSISVQAKSDDTFKTLSLMLAEVNNISGNQEISKE